jgi:hypothetical protein
MAENEVRHGWKCIASAPFGEQIVSMIYYRDKIYVATDRCIYELYEDTLYPIELEERKHGR